MNTDTAIVTAGETAVELAHYASADQNPARVYLASLAPGSRRTMEQALAAIATLLNNAEPKDTKREVQQMYADTFPWGVLRYQHTQAIRAALAAKYDAATANKMLSALRQVLKAAWRLGQFKPTPQEFEDGQSGSDLYMRAVDIKNVTGSKPDQAAGRALTLGELMALVAACNDGTLTGIRDAAILAVAYAGGLRRAEIVGLTLDSFDQAAGVLTVKGKRNKSRTVPMQNGALAALTDWLTVRGAQPGPMFTRIGKGGKLTHEGLTAQAVYYVFSERAEEANVRAFSPHDMRRTFAGDMLDAGVDISTVQKLMGHSNVTTTAGYDRRGERAKKDAAKRLHFPYQGRK